MHLVNMVPDPGSREEAHAASFARALEALKGTIELPKEWFKHPYATQYPPQEAGGSYRLQPKKEPRSSPHRRVGAPVVVNYYKGEGPHILVAEVPGIYHQWQPYHHGVKERRTRWPNASYMFGFRQGWGVQWVNSDYCDPGGMLVPGSREANAIAMMGKGVAPVSGIAVHSNFAIWFPPVVVLCLILWARAWVRRRRARRGAR